ncbi:hypothetical protein L7F22_052435 [Adiantum nelumboides]|nr:hypothetical protein [Adiantum nelumboides]
MESSCQHLTQLNGDERQYMGSYINFNPAPRHVFQPPICDAENLQVPPLHCSFPAELNPLYEEVKEQCDGWILAVAQPSSASARQLLLNCLLPRLVCRAIPASTSLKRLVHATKMISWLIIADDEDDHPAVLGADQITTTRHASQVLSILHRRPIHESAAATNTGGPLQKREAALLALASLRHAERDEPPPRCALHLRHGGLLPSRRGSGHVPQGKSAARHRHLHRDPPACLFYPALLRPR